MRTVYAKNAFKLIDDIILLANIVERRVKQLKRSNRPLVESLKKRSIEDPALREIAEARFC